MTILATDEMEPISQKPGAYLASIRVQRNLTPEYVASKLHLRIKIIELIEADDYDHMPEPVFIRGYLRAYAKLLEVPADSLLDQFNLCFEPEGKNDKTLWQNKRRTHKAEHAVRWLTSVFAIGVLTAVVVWWYNNREVEHIFSTQVATTKPAPDKTESEIRLTDLSKMRTLLSSGNANAFTPMDPKK